MAKAHIKTPDGITVEIQGTPAEISTFVDELKRKLKIERGTRLRGAASSGRPRLVDLIASLIDSGFFKKPKSLGSIKAALEEMGHHYPVTSLSAVMLRQVRRRALRRIREKKLWLYVG